MTAIHHASPSLETALPLGKTCANCDHFYRCIMLGVAHTAQRFCDWDPSRFVPYVQHSPVISTKESQK